MIFLKAFFFSDLVVCAGTAPEFVRVCVRGTRVHGHIQAHVVTVLGSKSPGR